MHSSFAAGGKELRAARLMNAFAADALGRPVHHAVVSAEEGAFGAKVALDSGLDVAFPEDFPSLQGQPLPPRLWRFARAMQAYDLVLTYNWGAMDGVMARALYGSVLKMPPLVHHEDGFNEDEAAGLKPKRNLFRRFALRGAASLVVPSQRLAGIAREVWHCPDSKLRLIGNGIALSAYGTPPAPDAVPGLVKAPGAKWVGTLAGLRAVKNLPRLVRAFAALPPEWHLVIVGEGPERTAIEAEARSLGLADRVHLPGFVARPADVVGLFDIFALSSDSEQFPISVVEAMAAGVPVASPAVGDVAAMVSAPNAPFITAPGDGQALGTALALLAGDAPLREQVGMANRREALARFDERIMIEGYRATYAAALGRDIFP
ncbi:glycosyltransferase [Novosphingobium sp. 9]|uniref:glycosyltransferase n=1 Tax=Novosphingobium sp. 9 TaxID=2025349 RepID=UPI0021B6DA36|nr:glycosyltransferase [Novosphingobium sp. 9]